MLTNEIYVIANWSELFIDSFHYSNIIKNIKINDSKKNAKFKCRKWDNYFTWGFLSDCDGTRTHNHLVHKRTMWFWVWFLLQSCELQILRLFRARNSLTFRQLWSVDSLWNTYVTWLEHTVQDVCWHILSFCALKLQIVFNNIFIFLNKF